LRASITTIPTRRLNGGQSVQIKIGHRLQGLGRRAAVQAGGEPIQPGNVLRLEPQEFGHGIVPPLWARAPVSHLPMKDNRRSFGRQPAGTVTSLPLRIAERALAGHFVVLLHTPNPVT
jgi:hypothetical protein